MKLIVLAAVAAALLAAVFGPTASVGGAMTIGFILLIAMLVVAIHEAWTHGRGPLGWVVNLVAAVFGGLIAASFGPLLIEPLIIFLPVEGSLAKSGHPLFYIGFAAMAAITVLGSWGTILLVNKVRDRRKPAV